MNTENIAINSPLYKNEELYESYLSWKDRQPNYLSRGIEYDPQNNVIALQTFEDGYQEIYFGKNLVVNDGSQYYVELINQETPMDDFTYMEVGNPATPDTIALTDEYAQFATPVVASNKLIDTTGGGFSSDYPLRNDPDTTNPGRGLYVFTWRTTWTSGDFDTEGDNTIKNGVIIPSATPVAGTHLLTHYEFTSPFVKSIFLDVVKVVCLIRFVTSTVTLK